MDCEENSVKCNPCGKKGHRAYEFYQKISYPKGWTRKRTQSIGKERTSNGNNRNRSQQTNSNSTQGNGNGQSNNGFNDEKSLGVGNGTSPQTNIDKVSAISYKEAKAAKDLVTCTLFINYTDVKVLFVLGAPYSFNSPLKIGSLDLGGLKETSSIVA